MGFTQEALAGILGAGQLRQHHLEGDLATQLGILGQKDRPHAALTQHLEDAKHTEPAKLAGLLGRGEKTGEIGAPGVGGDGFIVAAGAGARLGAADRRHNAARMGTTTPTVARLEAGGA
jgi:hypothetical protein